MITNLIISILPLVIPYTILGENLGALLLAIVACIYLIINKEKITVEKKYLYLLISLSVIAIISQICLSSYIESFSGIFNYINMVLYYIVISLVINNKNKDIILKYITIIVGIISVYYILVQGLYYDVRIYGNIGYANSYALLLLFSMGLNAIRNKDKYTEILDIIFILGILFTGSRTTLVLLVIYYVLRLKEVFIKKNQELFFIIVPFSFAIIQYVVYSSLGLASIVIAPILLFIYNGIIKVKKAKVRKIINGVICSALLVIIFISNTNTFQRIRNISLNNGSFQERLILFEDSFNTIINNPLGSGINMYKYKLYDDASAFYDVKYIHNSLLQTSYDIGILGGLVLLALLIYGLIIINRGQYKNKGILIAMYLSIFLHSLLDFDFSYSTFLIMWVMIVVISKVEKEDKNSEVQIKLKKSKIVIALMVPIILYLALLEGTLVIAKFCSVYNKVEASISVYSIGEKLSFNKDSRASFNKAEGYKKLYDEKGDIELLEKSLEALTNSKKINPYDPRILWNMAYIYEVLGNDDNTILIRNELLKKERFYPDLYEVYSAYAARRYEETEDERYKIIQEEIKNSYEDALKELNPRAKYLEGYPAGPENFQ